MLVVCVLVGWMVCKDLVCVLVVCVLVVCVSKMVPAACKDVSSSIRRPLYKLMYGFVTTLHSVCAWCIGPRAWVDVSSGASSRGLYISSCIYKLKLMYFTYYFT